VASIYCMCKPHCLHTSGSRQITVYNLAPGYVRGGIKCRYQKNIQPCPCLLKTCIYPKTCLLAVQQLGLWMQHYVHHWREDQKVNRSHNVYHIRHRTLQRHQRGITHLLLVAHRHIKSNRLWAWAYAYSSNHVLTIYLASVHLYFSRIRARLLSTRLTRPGFFRTVINQT